MKRGGYLQRRSPLKRKTRVRAVNPERKAKRDAVHWPQRDLCRTLPCAACGRPAPSDPAHIRTRASLAGALPSVVDRANVIPLCRACHSLQGSMAINQFEFWHLRRRTMKEIAESIAAQLEAEGVTW